MKLSHFGGVVLALCLYIPGSLAQGGPTAYEKRPIAAVKTTEQPVIDGNLSDPVWKNAPTAETFLDRQRGAVAGDQTIARVLYDEKFIYVAFECRDSRPDRIVARETARDHRYRSMEESDNEDEVEVTFDPFRTYKYDDFSQFSVNPLGTRSARIGGGRADKTEWKGDWDAAAKRTADGWTAEMRIPWAILNYPSSRQPITMGINFGRWQERTRTDFIWSNIGPQYYNELEGLWTNVEVPSTAFRPALSLLPYVLTGYHRPDYAKRTGMDARFALTPQLTLVGSMNPDFATIEGAVEGIYFSRSERYVPDRRPFFLEGSDYFDAGLGGPLFYSNRIATFDIGAKLYGKLTPSDTLGFLYALDAGNSSATVARYRRDLSATSQVSLFVTNRSAADDNNTVASASGGARHGKLGFGGRWAVSNGKDAGGNAKALDLTYGDKLNFTYVGYMDISPRFRDANGLTFFTDTRGFEMWHEWGAEWKRGFWRNFHVGGGGQYNWHANGLPFQRGYSINAFLAARSDWGIRLNAGHNRFDAQTDETYGMFLGFGLSNRFRQWGVYFSKGRQADQPYSSLGPGFSVRLFRKLDLAYSGTWQQFEGRQQQHILTVSFELSPTRSFGGRLVVQNADVNWYLSFRHSAKKGTETYLILGDPNAQRFTRQALVKMVFAL